jgi:hypothetical protein
LKLPDTSILLLGDARAEIISKSLQRLGYLKNKKLLVDYVKVSHHGSINNTSSEMLDLIEGGCYIISTNGGTSHHKHPDREVIARILYHPERNMSKKRIIAFNYNMADIEIRSGKLIDSKDLTNGNWEYLDNTQEFKK